MDKSNIEEMREAFFEAWESVKNIFQEVYEIIFEKGKHKRHDYNWYVPIKITLPPMPDLKLPKLHYARSNL